MDSNYNVFGIECKVWMAKDKLVDAINRNDWNVSLNSDEFYGLWMHFTRVEVAYAEATQLVAQMVNTAVIIGTTIYQAVVTVKSIGMLVNQKSQVSSQSYKSTINGINAMNQLAPDATNYSSTSNISGLQNTSNFKSGSINHVLKGEINKSGKAVGYHYEGFSDSQGSIINVY